MRPDASSATSAADTAPGFRCAGVALLRTPLLPLHRAAEAAVAVREATPAELRSYVASLTCEPEVREALLVSSESLSGTLDALEAADRQVARRTAYPLSRYWLRRSVTARMRRLQPARHVFATDLRLDAEVDARAEPAGIRLTSRSP